MLIKARIRSWEKYNPRKNSSGHCWFRLEHSWIDDPVFSDFSPVGKLFWIYLCSLRSRKHDEWFEFTFEAAAKVLDSKPSYLKNVFEKFVERNLIETSEFLFGDKKKQKTVEKEISPKSKKNKSPKINVGDSVDDETSELINNRAEERPTPRDLARVWNELVDEPIPKVMLDHMSTTSLRWQHAKKRLQEQPDLGYWREVITRICDSPFCRGENGRSWTANFDWLVKPETHVKAMEGIYGKGTAQSHNETVKKVEEILARRRIERGEDGPFGDV